MDFNLKKIISSYENFEEKSLAIPSVKFENIKPLIDKIKKNKDFRVRKIGASEEKRPVYSVTFGEGKKRILAWTQMHGNEPTATRVFFDLINFLALPQYGEIKKEIFSKLQIRFIPMLNPDGAEKNIRYNALGIDINRDAVSLTSEEAKMLDKEFNAFSPDFALNLHDQDCYYSAGDTRLPVWLSFLATVAGKNKKETAPRRKSIDVIGKTVRELARAGIKNIARYLDEFEPRAFGDNFVKNGSSVILIEAGCAEKSETKNFERRIFFAALISVLLSIAGVRKKDDELKSVYYNLPENREAMLDFIFRNVELAPKKRVSVGIKENKIFAVGDLSVYGAYENIDAKGLKFKGAFLPNSKANFELYRKNGEKVLSFNNGKIKWAK